jgi:hypothetical protein
VIDLWTFNTICCIATTLGKGSDISRQSLKNQSDSKLSSCYVLQINWLDNNNLGMLLDADQLCPDGILP